MTDWLDDELADLCELCGLVLSDADPLPCDGLGCERLPYPGGLSQP